ncbi:MAG: hypothetical protein DMG73_10960 [Acidobacteria bacterium]|nr:MAG: hypothetical protein DMG73_10960 [Acidobacteriota bacterium]
MLLCLLVNLADLLALLLRRERRVIAYRLHLSARVSLERLALLHGGLGYTGDLPAGFAARTTSSRRDRVGRSGAGRRLSYHLR